MIQAVPPSLSTISDAYADPPLFAEPAAREAMDKVIMDSLGRRGLWDAVSALEQVCDVHFHPFSLCTSMTAAVRSVS
jgi:hypothetical protein